jgi:hypothetical protein
LQLREWSAVDDELTAVSVDNLRRVLLYPHGWLVDPRPITPHEDDPGKWRDRPCIIVIRPSVFADLCHRPRE